MVGSIQDQGSNRRAGTESEKEREKGGRGEVRFLPPFWWFVRGETEKKTSFARDSGRRYLEENGRTILVTVTE